MSMFDRNFKLKFEAMKYKDLVSKNEPVIPNFRLLPRSIFQGRVLMLVTGFACGFSLSNTDVFIYKMTAGLRKWKGRVNHLFGKDGHH